ncbi:MAG: T9SS type A sorting domain-containing protein [Bacteroidia bacterium]
MLKICKKRIASILILFISITSSSGQYLNQISGDIDGGKYSFTQISISDDGKYLAGLSQNLPKVYYKKNGNWEDLNIRGLPNSSKNRFYTCAMSGDGNVLAIGNYLDDTYGTNRGIVKVYRKEVAGWIQMGSDIYSKFSSEAVGKSLELSADGQNLAMGINVPYVGRVAILQFNGNEWVQKTLLFGKNVGDNFGSHLDFTNDGKTIAVGAFSDSTNGVNSGCAVVYKNVNDKWEQVGEVILGDTANNRLGAISINEEGNLLVVGLPGFAEERGKIKVYKLQNNTWTEIWSALGKKISQLSNYQGDKFGNPVRMSGNGDIIAVGSRWWDATSTSQNHGRVYVYQKNNSSWKHFSLGTSQGVRGNSFLGSSGIYNLYGEHAGDRFGTNIAVSKNGKTLAVSANNQAQSRGYIRVYSNDLQPKKQLFLQWVGNKNDFERAYCQHSISADGKKMALLLPWDNNIGDNERDIMLLEVKDSFSTGIYNRFSHEISQFELSVDGEQLNLIEPSIQSGKNKLSNYRVDTNANGTYGLLKLQSTIEINNTWIHSFVSSGDGKIVALVINNTGGYYIAVFKQNNNNWSQIGSDLSLEYSGPPSIKLSQDGNHLCISEGFGDNEIRTVRIFQFINDNWTQIGGDIIGGKSNYFNAVAISSNGKRIANSSGANKSIVSVYDLVDNNWIQIGSNIENDDIGDGNGADLELSGDGKRLVIGSPYAKDNGIQTGQVRVFQEQNGNWLQEVEIVGQQASNAFGGNISFSKNGNRILIGTNLYQNWRGYEVGMIYGYKLNLDTTTYQLKQKTIKTKNHISCFPNPTSDVINIDIQPSEQYNTYEIYNSSGLFMSRSSLHLGLNKINIKEFSSGLYFIKLTGQKTKTLKLLKP